jgi:hypothetical protein
MALIFLTMSAKHDGQIPWLVSPGTSPSLCFQRMRLLHQAHAIR